ncbi:hypothetical protein DFQ27_005822 [Actinomortierella ambigua]|uniref:Uncharacterized protein n=1 Tax=Actinomortierella ambigua TaxID=1343610 RepID=A0A9P6QJJ8_9FUNG|nr:hypothetical protein DFQ27_005822 [Actinomortierella ambigua]
MNEHQHRTSGKKHGNNNNNSNNSNSSNHHKSHRNSHVHHPAPIHHTPHPTLLSKCSCDRYADRSPSPVVDTRQGASGTTIPRSPPIASSAHSRLRRIWRDSNLFHWPRQSPTTTTTSTATSSIQFQPTRGGASPRVTSRGVSGLPADALVAASSPSGRAPASSSPSFAKHHLRRPYPAHTHNRNASPYVSDEGNHSISEHEEEEEEEEEDDFDEENGIRFTLGRAAHIHRSSFQGDDLHDETRELVLRSFPEGERLESELDRCSPEPPSPPPPSSSRKVLMEDEDEDEDDEDWDIQSDAGAPSSSPMYTVGAAQPTSFSTGHQHHHRQHGGASAVTGSLGNRGMFKLPSLPSENWDEDFEIEAENINVPTQVVETQISLQMDIYNIKDFALQIEDLKTLRASLRTASRSLRAKNPNKYQHLSTVFQRDWEQAEVIIDLGEIAQTQTQPSRPSTPTAATKRPLPRRPSKRRLTHHKSKSNMANAHASTVVSPAIPVVAAASPPLPSPRESAWKRFSRMATGSSSNKSNGVTSPAMSVGSPAASEGHHPIHGYFGPVESNIVEPSPLTSPHSEMASFAHELSLESAPPMEEEEEEDNIGSPSSVSRPVVVMGANRHDHGGSLGYPIDDAEAEEGGEARSRGRVQEGEGDDEDDEQQNDEDDDDDDDLIDDGYESFSCYSYSFMDGPITGVVSPIPSDRHMQVLKDILVEGLGQEVAQQFVFKNGEQDHVKFSVEVIPGLLNHLKGLQYRLSEQLREFQQCDEQHQHHQQQQQHHQQQQQQQQAHDLQSSSQQEIDRNQRPGRASMGGGDSLRHHHLQHNRRKSMRQAMGLDFGDGSSVTLSATSTHVLKEVENETEAVIEPVAV